MLTFRRTHMCVCKTGFVGDGFYCSMDSDNDGYANVGSSTCSDDCLHCQEDPCPNNSEAFDLRKADFEPLNETSYLFPFYFLNDTVKNVIISPDEGLPNWQVTTENPLNIEQFDNSLPAALVGKTNFDEVKFGTYLCLGYLFVSLLP